MMKAKLNYLTSILVTALVLSGCAGLNKMADNVSTVGYQVNPNPLETHGDQTLHANAVKVTIDTRFPQKYFNKKAVLVATPVLRYEGGETAFTPTTLQGEKVEANNKVIPYAGGSYTYTGTVTYKPEMMKSSLFVKMSATKGSSAPVVFETVKIADGVVATPLLIKADAKTINLPDNFQRITPENYTADIHYVINQSTVRSSELKAQDIQQLEASLVAAEAAANKEIKGIQLSSYASPDGPLTLNERLSVNRESAAQKYLAKALADNKITAAETEGFLNLMTTPEDWNGFKELMEKSTIADKDLILRVLSMYSDPVVRENEIKNISQAYTEIAEKILPQLRRSVVNVNVEVTGKSDSELLNLARTSPRSLTANEILKAANLSTSLTEKAAIYKAASEAFPGDIRTFNNLGNVYLQQGNLADAKTALEAAQKIDNSNAVVKANLGAVALANGDISGAEQLLTSAMSAGSEVSYNLGIIKVKQGDYAAAVNYFGNEASFNAALAQFLNGNNDRALATLNQMGEVKDGWVYYLKALINAETGNASALYSNLRSAVSLDNAIKAYATKDASFLRYAADNTFTQILQ